MALKSIVGTEMLEIWLQLRYRNADIWVRMNDFSNQQIKNRADEIRLLGERTVDAISAKFDELCPLIQDAIALQYLLNQNQIQERFGLLDCLDEMISQLHEYAGLADDEEQGRAYLLEKLFSGLVLQAKESSK